MSPDPRLPPTIVSREELDFFHSFLPFGSRWREMVLAALLLGLSIGLLLGINLL